MKKSHTNLIFSISGLREIVGEGLTPELVVRYASAYGYLSKGKIVVGRDTRNTGEMIKNLVISSLVSVGCEVVDIGICPTPTVELAVLDLTAQGGIAITASHNPIEWNALKFVNSEGMFITEQQKNKIDKLTKNQNIEFASWDKIGKVSKDSFQIEKHINKILNLNLVNAEKIREKRFKVVIDCVNGAGSFASPVLLEKLGCEVIKINCQNTGTFPHPPEPVPSTLSQLCDTVQQYQADIGFANDPDADRLAIVSEKGEAIGEEYTLALATKYVLSKKKGPVVVNLSTTKMIDDVAKMYNSPVHRTKVGEANVGLKLKQIKGVIGGEGNGGVILPHLQVLHGLTHIIDNAKACGLRAPQGAAAAHRLAGDHARGVLPDQLGVLVHHPAHHLGCGAHVWGRDVLARADVAPHLVHPTAAQALFLVYSQSRRVNRHAALAATQGDICHSGLPGH